MKLMQINSWSGRLLKILTELIQDEKPDLICLQEVVSLDSDIHSLLGTVEELQKNIDFPEVFYSAVFSFRLMNKRAEWGNCILSQSPIIKGQTVFTNNAFVEDFNFEEFDYNIRNLQHVVIDINGRKLNLLNHHGHHIPEHKNGDAETLRQTRIIADYCSKLKGPIIICGDFNLAPRSKSLEQINKQFTNLPLKYNLKTT